MKVTINGKEFTPEKKEDYKALADLFIKEGGHATIGTGSEILDEIQREMAVQGVKTSDVAELLGVHPSVASKFLNNPTDKIIKLEKVMKKLNLIVKKL